MIQNSQLSGMRIRPASRLRGFLVGKLGMIAVAAFVAPQISVMLKAQDLIPANLSVGRNLQADARIRLSAPAPTGGLIISLHSNDPGRLLLSKDPRAAGSESIQLKVNEGVASTPEFYLQGLADSGTATYTVSAADHAGSTGSVTLAPSALVIAGRSIVTVSGAPPSRITVMAAQMDESGQFSISRSLRGGFSAQVHLVSSEPKVGKIVANPLVIAGGDSGVTTQFAAASPGTTMLALEVPPAFHDAPALKVTVNVPGLAITDQQPLGKDLQIAGSVSLGAVAPEGGVTVTLTSSDPTRLLLSDSISETGSKSVTVTIPAGGHNAQYFLQALADSGNISYNAVASGYRNREAVIQLTPSGVVLGAPLAPDEAEVLRPYGPDPPHGFVCSLVDGPTAPIGIHVLYLDPKTHRGADITEQALRPGVSLTVSITNSNPAVGSVPSTLTIKGGTMNTLADFKILSPGSTVLGITTPPGFTTPTNSQTYTAIVR